MEASFGPEFPADPLTVTATLREMVKGLDKPIHNHKAHLLVIRDLPHLCQTPKQSTLLPTGNCELTVRLCSVPHHVRSQTTHWPTVLTLAFLRREQHLAFGTRSWLYS
ncbi:hypothetical protein FPOAC2_04537 [Fusarium poae]